MRVHRMSSLPEAKGKQVFCKMERGMIRIGTAGCYEDMADFIIGYHGDLFCCRLKLGTERCKGTA